MKIGNKIKQLIKDKGWTLNALHQEIHKLFEKNTVSYRTLLRAVHDQTHLRESTLFQIACILGKTPAEIREGTGQEEKFTRYSYNNKAYLEIESTNLDFLTARLVLLPGAKTEIEQDPSNRGNFVKWIYGLQGELTCAVLIDGALKKYTIKKNESHSFPSTYPHYFENYTSQKSVGLLIQNPKYM